MAADGAAARVAVVIPCFDDGETLPAAVASTRAQEPVELAVVDDGSTAAGTCALLAELERDGVRVVRQTNAGVAAARMAGVEATKAPYVFPLDADDLLEPQALTRLADALDAHPDAAAAWGDVRRFGAHESTLRYRRGIDPWRITFLNSQPAGSLYRREHLVAAGGWPRTGGFEDWDLWMTFAERGLNGVFVPGIVYRYRSAPGRRRSGARARFEAEYAALRTRHTDLFARRTETRRGADAPLRERVAFPLLERLPVGELAKAKLRDLVSDPARLLLERVRRLRRSA